MPQVRKLAPEEVQALEHKGKGTRKLTEELYDAILTEYEVGDYGEAELDADEKLLTVRNRLRAAAARRNVGIAFRRSTGNMLRFHIVAASQGSETPAAITSEPPAPAKRKGGRPRKSA